MNANARKNQKLIKKYPFVAAILQSPMEPFGGPDGKLVDDLAIRFQIADGELLFRKADNWGLGDNSSIFGASGRHEGQIGRTGECLFAVSESGQILNRIDWPKTRDEARKAPPVYGWTALWAEKHADESYSSPLWGKVRYLVWVRVSAWHKDTGIQDLTVPGSRFGEFLSRAVSVTVYREPNCGFEKLYRDSNGSRHEYLHLDSNTMMTGQMAGDPVIINIGGRLDELCQCFQDEVYFDGMKRAFNDGEGRGASGKAGSIEILVAEMCGYERVMLQNENSWISFQLRPASDSLYVVGMGGTLRQIRVLVRGAIASWTQGAKPMRAEFKPNANVQVM